MTGNVIVGQSGGPTAVINSSLAGVFKTAKDLGAEKIYGMRYGIQGFLEKNIIDMSEKIRSDMDLVHAGTSCRISVMTGSCITESLRY